MGTTVVVTIAVDIQILRNGALLTQITAPEGYAALLSIRDDKLLLWMVIRPEFFKLLSIHDFFTTVKLLKSLNTTLLTLIPKVNAAPTV